MEARILRRNAVIETVVRSTDVGFWRDVMQRWPIAYADAFAEVAVDAAVLPQQRPDDLVQRRHFRAEKLLADIAAAHGLGGSTTAIPENRRHRVYVFRKGLGLSQSYVTHMGAATKDAKFRRQHANAAKMPRFELGDEAMGVLDERSVYGIIAHNPVGRAFSAGDQALGNVQLCIPDADCQSWEFELGIAEIIAGYASRDRSVDTRRMPVWKRRDEDPVTGTGGTR